MISRLQNHLQVSLPIVGSI